MVLMLRHLEAIPTFTSQKTWISFFHKIPHQAINLSRATPTNLAIFKTNRTQNIRAPRILWYSFGDSWRPFQPSHLKNHEFHFFHKNNPPSHLPMPCYTDQLGHVQKNTELKALVHQEFYGTHLGTLGGHSNLYISKTMNFIFSQNTPPSLSKPCTPTNLAMCKTHRTQYIRAPRILCYSFGDIWRPIQPSHLKNHEFRFFTKYPTKPST